MIFDINNISEIIKKQITEYSKKIKIHEEGVVITVGDGIAVIDGLDNAMLGELLVFPNNIYGMILNLEENYVSAILLGNDFLIKEKDYVYRTNKIIETIVGDELLGRIVNALGFPIDGKGPFKNYKTKPIEHNAYGIMSRKTINKPLETGILMIDSMIPIGKGQRELIIGDRQTGKTSIAINTIINQKNKNVKCIYVAIGQKISTVIQIVEKLKMANAMSYTTIVLAGASDLVSLQYLSPYTGTAIGEEWMEKGEDILIIYDDLTKHAIAYRTISLLLHRPPGREAFPGDIFYLHSRLLERACSLNIKYGGGSITALPIIETQSGDISSYIPTNVISITDGQIFLNSNMFNLGIRPSIDIGLSVSRVGSFAQIKAMKIASSTLKLELAQYREMQSFLQFGGDLDESTKQILEHGKRIVEMLIQKELILYSPIYQIIMLLSIKNKRIKWIPIKWISYFKNAIIEHFNKKGKKYYNELKKTNNLNDNLINNIDKEIIKIIKQITNKISDYKPELYGNLEEWNNL